MKNAIELFAALGNRLERFGNDAATREVILRASDENPWFSPEEIRRAVESLVREMLQCDKLRMWLAAYPALPVAYPAEVLVIMAGNIPLVGFFDLLCVVASGHRCRIKPSAKDRVLMEYVVQTLRELDPEVPVAISDGTERAADAVIATGSDNANRYFRAHYAGIPTLLRGHRQSVAVLSGMESEQQLKGLADDIWSYSGLGCRNVSMLFLPEGYHPALTMPSVHPKYRNNYLQTRALLTMQGHPFLDLGAAVAVEQREFPMALSELSYSRYRTIDEVAAWLAVHDAELQCVVTKCLEHPRRVAFGQAQSPRLTDYPDARDVMAWLSEITPRHESANI